MTDVLPSDCTRELRPRADRRRMPPHAWDSCRSWRELFEEALGRKSRRVLVVACADGDAAFLLHALGHQVHGVDADALTVERLRSRADAACASADFRTSDPEDLRFPAGVFDAVHARGLVAGASRPGLLLLEWYRVLRPGGAALVVEDAAQARPSQLLRAAGFLDVVERELRLPRRCIRRAHGRAPWYRLWTTRTRLCRVAWGLRP